MSRSTAPSRRTPLVSALRVVVVDDLPDVRDLVAELLPQHGHDVETADDGPGAIELVRRFRPDVAFINIGLPTLSGYEVARTLRHEMKAETPRLIALTGHGREADRI